MTPLRVSIVAAIASAILLFVIFELIRRRRLREKYAILWLLTGLVLLVLSVWRSGLDTIAGFAQVSYAPGILFALGSMFVLVVLIHYATVISKLADQNLALAQRLAMLEERLRRARASEEQGAEALADPTPEPDG